MNAFVFPLSTIAHVLISTTIGGSSVVNIY